MSPFTTKPPSEPRGSAGRRQARAVRGAPSRPCQARALLALALLFASVTAVAAQQPARAGAQAPARGTDSYPRPIVRERAGVGARAPAATRSLSDTARALHLLARATFGVRSADLAEVLREGRVAWVERQLHPERIDDSGLEARLADYPAASMDAAALYRAYPPAAALKRLAQARAAADSMSGAGGAAMDDSAMTGARARRRVAAAGLDPGAMRPARMVADFAGARLARAVYSQRQLQEVMTDFWFNHFNVFVGKGPDRYLVAAYEREAIRPHVFGRFEDMLKATALHPAMLVYLDNWMNTAPDTTSVQYQRRQERLRRFQAMTPEQRQALVAGGRMTQQQLDRLTAAAAQAERRKPGINENYARELMELHTLGVDGGYTQQDVIAVARAFTGWTITRARVGPNAPADADVAFVFRPELHDRKEKVVLGTPLRAGRGMEDGLEVLHLLATSPATARHIARQLVERFVTDRPDSVMVERIARVFLETDGDLRAVTRALFTDPAFDDARYVDAKVKTPLELVASALRVTSADIGPGPSRAALNTLRTLGELPYGASFPTGYPAASAEWVNGGAMLNRVNFALALAAGRLDHVRVDLAGAASGAGDLPVTPVADARDGDESGARARAGGPDAARVHALAARFLPGRDTRALEARVRDELARQPAPTLAYAAGLLLGSPEFQRR